MTNRLRPRMFVLTGVLIVVAAAAAPAIAQFIRFDRILAYDTDIWRVWAPAGQTRVTVDGDGDTDLDCWVYDRFGNQLGHDTDGTDLCIIGFRNPSSGNLTVRIRNLGGVYNDYRLTVE